MSWEAQRIHIEWQQGTTSDELRGELQRLNEMMMWTPTTGANREERIDEFIKTITERLKAFAFKVEGEFTREKAHRQSCIDAWVKQFTEQMITGVQAELGSLRLELATEVDKLQIGQGQLEDQVQVLEAMQKSLGAGSGVTALTLEDRLREKG